MVASAIVVAFVGVILLFGFVVWVGPPYIPTLQKQIEHALDVLQVEKGQMLLELGSGDGRVALAAAKRGIHVVGIEINPLLVLYSRIITWRYRRFVLIKWGNIWRNKWPEDVDVIYTFLLDKYMKKLDKKITQTYSHRSIRLASFAFEVPNKKAVSESSGIYVYVYPKLEK